jgi:ribosome-associated translation inhibitor RaiA
MEEVVKLEGNGRYEEYRSSNDISLKEYIDVLFLDMQRGLDLRTSIIQTAVDKAELELSNKFHDSKAYVDIRFTDLQIKMDVHFSSIQTAIDKAETAINTRLEGMNEFRDQLKDQAGQFVTRPEFTGLKDQVAHHITRGEFAAIQKLVYVGLGAVLAIELLLKFITK